MATTSQQALPNQMIVTFDDISVMPQVKKAIALMKGVKSIKMPRKKKRMTGLEEAMLDVKEGRVSHAKDVDDLFKHILGDDYVLD